MIKFNNFLKFSKNVRLGILVFIGIVVILLVIISVDFFDRSLRVSFYDIGQGDAIFIETPKNYQILIDGGPGPSILRKLGRDMPFWDRTIDLIVATHPDADHISGLIDVMERYKVKNILISPVISKDTVVFKKFYKAIWNEGARLYLAQAGQSFSDINFQVLYPFEFSEDGPREDFNDMSIVNLLEYKNPCGNLDCVKNPCKTLSSLRSLTVLRELLLKLIGKTEFCRSSNKGQTMLFTGDATKVVEKMLLEKYPNLDIDILRVGHHGSKTSSSFNFLKSITPDLAIIQVGRDNRYKHPHQSVIDRFQNLGIPIWRTDLDGDLRLRF